LGAVVSGAARAWTRLLRGRSSRAALIALSLLIGAAVFADELAADLPVLARVEGHLYLLPCAFNPRALRNRDLATLAAKAGPGDWQVPPLIPFGPNRIATESALRAPGRAHWLGTDELGRDVLARLIHGARASLAVGLGAVLLYVLIGTGLGALAGFYRGRVDAAISKAVEVLLSFPALFLVLGALALIRVQTVLPLIAVLGLTRWTEVARLVRAEVIRLHGEAFVGAARALGAGDGRLLVRHLLPNALGPVWVALPFGIAGAILIESALSFLGFGVPPPAPSWGELLTQAHRYLTHPGAWWLAVFPGLAIFFTVASFNVLGEAVRDALDPRYGR
jgi:peptide/nickel transport system permease protein